jgi:hypothetical protein
MTYRAQPIPDQQGRFQAPSAPVTPAQLAAAQQAEHARLAQAIKDREQREAEARAERERIAAEQGAAELDAYRERARAAVLSSGGSSADFEKTWPDLKLEWLKEQARSRMTHHERLVERAKDELRERMRGQW